MKVYLVAGHGAGDPGATALGYTEAALTRELVRNIHDYTSFDFFDTSINAFKSTDTLLKSIPSNVDLLLEIHFNAFSNANAKGTEVYLPSTCDPALYKDIPYEQLGIKVASAIGTTWRGVKKAGFRVIEKVASVGVPAILLETCFITSPEDMGKYNVYNVANVIAHLLMKAPVRQWYTPYADKCKELGIITDGRYNEPVTKAELCKVVCSVLEMFGK